MLQRSPQRSQTHGLSICGGLGAAPPLRNPTSLASTRKTRQTDQKIEGTTLDSMSRKYVLALSPASLQAHPHACSKKTGQTWPKFAAAFLHNTLGIKPPPHMLSDMLPMITQHEDARSSIGSAIFSQHSITQETHVISLQPPPHRC